MSKNVLESHAKPLLQNKLENKGVFFICVIGINGGTSLDPILYCWKIDRRSQTSSEGHNQTSALPLFFELALEDQYGEKIKS